jgi:hypothetical protein
LIGFSGISNYCEMFLMGNKKTKRKKSSAATVIFTIVIVGSIYVGNESKIGILFDLALIPSIAYLIISIAKKSKEKDLRD